MVSTITTHNQIPKNVVFKKKEPFKNKSLADWQEEERLQHSFEETIRDIQQKEPLGANIQTLFKSNFTKNFDLDIENQFFGSTYATDLLVLSKILMSLDLPKISVQPIFF
jgi:hypothetical protein